MEKTIEMTCLYCGKHYTALARLVRQGRQTTCSRKCSYLFRKKKLPYEPKISKQKYSKIYNLICPVCNNEFTRKEYQIKNTKYVNTCSIECYKKIVKTNIIPKTKPEKYEFDCKGCGKHIVQIGVKGHHAKRKFCSSECFWNWNKGVNHVHWRNGYDRNYGRTWNRQRSRARKRDNYTCQICGITEKEYCKALDVHHIKRFADFPDSSKANRLKNLISLCNSCHTKRETIDNPNRYKY